MFQSYSYADGYLAVLHTPLHSSLQGLDRQVVKENKTEQILTKIVQFDNPEAIIVL